MELRKLAYDSGGLEALTMQAQMMERIKSLAVSVLHRAVHTVSLHEAEQAPEESVKTFVAWVRGIAANCELEKACTCGAKVNYTEETLYHVVLAGLRDRDLQARCTSQALLKQITDINSLVNFCTAEESRKLGAAATVSGLRRSGYKQQKAAGAAANQNSNKSTCWSCGATHSSYSMQIRERECKAFRVDCRKCGVKGHFEKFCNKEKKVAANTAGQEEGAAADATQQEVRENSAIEFSFFAVEVQNRFGVLEQLDQEVVPRKMVRATAPGRDWG